MKPPASGHHDPAQRVQRERGHEHQPDADRQRDRLAEDQLPQLAHQAATGSRTSAAISTWETTSSVAAM